MFIRKFRSKKFWQGLGVGFLAVAQFFYASPCLAQSLGKVVGLIQNADREDSQTVQLVDEFSLELAKQLGQLDPRAASDDKDLFFQGIQRDLLGKKGHLKRLQLDSSALHLIAARRAYFQFQFQDCIQQIQQGQGKLNRLQPDDRFQGFLPYQFAVLKGVCHLALGEKKKARNHFVEAIRFRPKAYLSPVFYSPEVIEVYEKARKIFEKRFPLSQRSSLVVQTHPPFAKVSLNGVFSHQSPNTIENLPQGVHFITVTKQDYSPVFARINISQQEKQKIRIELPVSKTATGQESESKIQWVSRILRDDPLRDKEIESLGRLFGKETWFLVEVEERQGEYTLIVARRVPTDPKPLQIVERHFFTWDLEVQALISEVLGEMGLENNLIVQAPSAGEEIYQESISSPKLPKEFESQASQLTVTEPTLFTQPPPRAHKVRSKIKPWYQKWWIWSIAAVVVAGAATGTALALGSGGGDDYQPATMGPAGGNPSSGVIVGQQGYRR